MWLYSAEPGNEFVFKRQFPTDACSGAKLTTTFQSG